MDKNEKYILARYVFVEKNQIFMKENNSDSFHDSTNSIINQWFPVDIKWVPYSKKRNHN